MDDRTQFHGTQNPDEQPALVIAEGPVPAYIENSEPHRTLRSRAMIEPLTLKEEGDLADIYLLVDGGILKLFCQGIPPATAYKEVTGTRAAQAAGIKTPTIREVVDYQGRPGIVFERLPGPTILQALALKPERAEELGGVMAEAHADLHARGSAHPPSSQLPSLRDTARREVASAEGLPEPIKAAALSALESLPSGTTLCHGNVYPPNVVLTPDGPVFSDWSNACIGCPVADVTLTVLLLRYMAPDASGDPDLAKAIDAIRVQFHNAYCRHYTELRPEDAEQVTDWQLPIGAVVWKAMPATPQRQKLLAWLESLIPAP